MVHMKKDLRAKKSAQLLLEGLISCMKRAESFDEIHVLDVVEESGVSRATFYRNFDTLIDLLVWWCDELFRTLANEWQNRPVHDEMPLSAYVLAGCMKAENADLLEALYRQKRTDVIYESFLAGLGPVFADADPGDLPLMAGLFTGTLQAWFQGGRNASVQEILERVSAFGRRLEEMP